MNIHDRLLSIISNLHKNLKHLWVKINKKVNIFMDKQKSIEALYNPVLEEKIHVKNNLYNNVLSLKNLNKDLDIQCNKMKNKNIEIQNSISALQKLLIK